MGNQVHCGKVLLMSINPAWSSVVSDLFVNLSAGWFGAVLIVPNFFGLNPPFNSLVLTGDILAGIFSLLIAFKLKKRSKKKL